MKEIEKAQMGIIAVLALMLVSIKRRLPGTRKLSSGITTLALAGIVLLVAAGGASADTPITSCNFDAGTDGEYYYLTGDLDCSGSESGVIIGANNVIIDGKGYKLNGSSVGAICDDGSEAIPCVAHSGVVNNGGWDNVVVKNLEIENFCTGVTMGAQGAPVENMTVEKCKIHDCGDNTNPSPPLGVTHGIHLSNANYCTITKNEIFNQTGSETMADCASGGNGIAMYGGAGGDYNTVTCNYLHDNGKCGLHAKKGCMWNDISYNRATENTGAGIMPECKQSDYNTFEYNNMSGNGFGGFYTCGDDNTIRYNTANGNGYGLPGGYGFQIVADTKMGTPYGQSNEVTNNSFSNNSGNDVDISQNQYGWTNTVDDMTCDNGNNATYCDDWSSNNLVSVYYDFDNDGYYSDDDCPCTNPAGGKCACCNPGLFNESGVSQYCAGGVCTPNRGTDPNDCNSSILGTSVDWYCDGDGDTYISTDVSGSGEPGQMPEGCQLAQGDDCNDGNAAVNPGATENCTNGIDDDCNGDIDCADSYCKPDLDITVKKEEWINDTHYNVNYTVCNIGICEAGASSTSIYIDGTVKVSDPVGILTQNDCDTNTVGPFLWTAPSDNVTVCADGGSLVDEKDEGNNCEINTLLARGVDIYVDPSLTNITPQDQFDINIMVNPNSIPIYGVEYYLTYNTSVLRAESQVKGPFLGTTSETIVVVNEIDRGAGIVSYAETRKDSGSGIDVEGISSVIQFTAIGAAADCTDLTLSGVIIVNTSGGQVSAIIENGEVCLTNNQAPVALGCTKHLHNNVQKKFECLAQLCSNSTDPDAGNPDAGGEIVYIRWSFGDGEYGTSEGLGDCPCKYHSYTSWIWEPFGATPANGGHYEPFTVELTVTDNGDPQLENTTSFDVNVYLAGDANYDGTVNILDAVLIGLTWADVCTGTDCCELLWAGNEKADKADLNNDCKINILDAVIVGTMWNHNAYYPV